MRIRVSRVVASSVVALSLVTVGVGPIAYAGPPEQLVEDDEARGHFERGQAAFAAGEYETAITELKAAYAIEEAPILLYAWAQAERLAGDCERAIELYARFLATSPPDAQEEKARSNIEVCGGDPDAAYVAPPPPPDKGVSEAPEGPEGPIDAPEPEQPKPEILGPVLLAGGGVLAVTGAVLLGVGLGQGQRAVDADTQDEFVDQTDGARGLYTVGLVLVGVGAAVLIGGGVRMGMVGAKKKGPDVALGPLMLPGGGGLGAAGRF